MRRVHNRQTNTVHLARLAPRRAPAPRAHATEAATPGVGHPGLRPAQSALCALKRPALSVGCTVLGGVALSFAAPPVATAFWAASALSQAACLVGAVGCSYVLIRDVKEAAAALVGLVLGLLLAPVLAPGAAPAAIYLAGGLTSLCAISAARFSSEIRAFALASLDKLTSLLQSLVIAFLIAMTTLAAIAFYLAQKGHAAQALLP